MCHIVRTGAVSPIEILIEPTVTNVELYFGAQQDPITDCNYRAIRNGTLTLHQNENMDAIYEKNYGQAFSSFLIQGHFAFGMTASKTDLIY